MGKSISPTENLAGNTAIEKIKTIAENAGTCFFSTNLKTNQYQ